MYIYTTASLTYSSVVRHLGCFLILPIANSIAINTGVYRFFYKDYFCSLNYDLNFKQNFLVICLYFEDLLSPPISPVQKGCLSISRECKNLKHAKQKDSYKNWLWGFWQ